MKILKKEKVFIFTSSKFLKSFLALLISIMLTNPLSSKQILSEEVLTNLLKDGLATVSDVANLLYYSLTSRAYIKNLNKYNSKKSIESTSTEEVRRYLLDRGIDLPKGNRPVTRQEFAKTLIILFELPVGFITTILKTPTSYFSDAQDLGIFSTSDLGSEVMSTKSMLNAYFKAKKVHLQTK